jgi:DNA replication protein DnaC
MGGLIMIGLDEDLMEIMINTAESKNPRSPIDYLDDDGFLICGNCNTRKQCEIRDKNKENEDSDETEETKTKKYPIPCLCRKQQIEKEEEERKRYEFKAHVGRLRRDGLTELEYLRQTFATDDRKNPQISDFCMAYVENWKQVKADKAGILFYGSKGTGKSYLACCIANALLDKQVTALVTSFTRIHSLLRNSFDDPKHIDALQRYDLVVFDDFGAEGTTARDLERTFSIIDTRILSGKPMIITTNFSPQDLKNPENLARERIYDRILERSIAVEMTGISRRKETCGAINKKYRNLLGLNGGKK